MRPGTPPSRRTARLRSRLAALAVVAGVGVSAVLLPAPTGADELSDKRAAAERAASQLAALDGRLQQLSGEAERAKGELAQAEQAVSEAEDREAEVRQQLGQRQDQLRSFAVEAYVSGNDRPGIEALLSNEGSEVAPIQGYLSATTANRRDLIDQLAAARQQAEAEGERLAEARTRLEERNEHLRSSLDDAQQAVDEQEAIKARLDGEVARLVEEARKAEEARQAAARQAAEQAARQQQAAAAPTTTAARGGGSGGSSSSGGGDDGPSSPAPPMGQGAGAAINAAMSKIGARYVWAAAGPDTFDCSGFTQWAWKHGGKSLAHYTGSQLAQSRRISAAEAQPGDLVFFWGPGESGDPGHVGLYLGGGSFVHAPGTGKFVRVDSVGYWSGARVAYGRV